MERSRNLATVAHKGQTRWGGEPYITHPEAVANAVKKYNDEKTVCVAWLHDVVEDTNVTIEEIFKEFGNEIGNGVLAITKTKDQSYLDYIRQVSRNVHATRVKIADIEHNLQSLKKGSMKDKYELALYMLKYLL